MQFASLTNALQYRATCPECLSPLIMTGDLTFRDLKLLRQSRIKNNLSIDGSTFLMPFDLKIWSLGSYSETYDLTLFADLKTLLFNVEFSQFLDEVPRFMVKKYVDKFHYMPNLYIRCFCREHYNYLIRCTLNHFSSHIENIQLFSEYRDIKDDIKYHLTLNHHNHTLTIKWFLTKMSEQVMIIPHFTYSLDDPELLNIIKSSLILG